VAIKKFLTRSSSLGPWLVTLVNPPPLSSMNFWQKVGRVLLFSATLVVGSILAAMIGALALYLIERGREMGRAPEFWNGVMIILAGISVNAACLVVLMQLKRADTKLMKPPEK
jgi:ABC-type Fe3+-siderophore transport system permease subunit